MAKKLSEMTRDEARRFIWGDAKIDEAEREEAERVARTALLKQSDALNAWAQRKFFNMGGE